MHNKGLNTEFIEVFTNLFEISTPPLEISTPPRGHSTPPGTRFTITNTPFTITNTPPPITNTPPLETLPEALLKELKDLKKREDEPDKIKELIRRICSVRAYKTGEIALILERREDYIKRKFPGPMIASKELRYLHPEMINHPEQHI